MVQQKAENWTLHSSLGGVLVPPALPVSLLCMFTHLVVNSGPDVEALVRALLCNFWLHYEETVIVLMKEMERTTEERDDIVYDENQQCGILPIQISKSIIPLWLFSLL